MRTIHSGAIIAVSGLAQLSIPAEEYAALRRQQLVASAPTKATPIGEVRRHSSSSQTPRPLPC